MANKNFRLYLAGAEIPGWKKLLTEAQSPMAVSFKGIERRRAKTKPYILAEKFDNDLPLLLDSGAHSFNTKTTVDLDEMQAYAERYEQFVADNIDRCTLVSEFDSVHLGREWVESRREAFYNQLPPSKFMAVWHQSWGLDALRNDASKYDVLGVTATETSSGSNLQPILHGLARAGVKLHGIALTKPDVLRTIPFASASSTSWLSPMQYGDTIVWDGQMLHRYPREYKTRARIQHKMLFERAGFDAKKIQNGDATEVARFTIWSWMQAATALAGLRAVKPSTDPFNPETGDITVNADPQTLAPNSQTGGLTTAETPAERSNEIGKLDPREGTRRDELVVLPVLAVERLTSTETLEDGKEVTHEQQVTRFSAASARHCNNCYISEVCVMFRPGAACAYQIPVEARTADQRRALMEGVIEMQAQRVMFMRMAEDRNGGYPDPNLSAEIKSLFNLLATKHEIEDDRDSFEMTIKSKGRATRMQRIFGKEAPPRHGTSVMDIDPLAIVDEKVPIRS